MGIRKDIILEARKQFLNNGITNTQMKDIAVGAGISRRTLYRYFETKDILAYEIELVVMTELKKYFLSCAVEDESLNGFNKVLRYYQTIDLNDIRGLIKYTAEFGRYFQGNHPTKEREQTFIKSMEPKKKILYKYIEEGVEDGSIRNDLPVTDIYYYLSHSLLALYQRIVLREQHHANEYCDTLTCDEMFIEITVKGIMANKN